MSKLVFDAVLLELCERHRQPGPAKNVPGESEEERDRRRKMDLAHRQSEREVWLQDTHAEFGRSRGWIVSKKPCPLAYLFFNTRDVEPHDLPKPLAALETSSLHTVTYRYGPGSGLANSILLHSSMPLKEVQIAAGILKTAGLRPERLPFSIVNPRGCIALLVLRPHGSVL